MRIVFIGSVYFSKITLLELISQKVNVVGIITKSESQFNSDFEDLTTIAQKFDIPYKIVRDINHENNIQWINQQKPDIIFCFGWSSLLKKEILNLSPMGVLGYHPALLPQNKGRHPLIWAKVLGLEKTGSTFFFMDEGADTGDILSQKEFSILFEDDALSLYNKMINTALKQIHEFIPLLQNKNFTLIKQPKEVGNVWRKRGKNDGLIDFRMSADAICNLVRGLSKPYAGAHLIYNNEEIKVWAVARGNNQQTNLEPGKVLNILKNFIEVKTNDGSIIITDHNFLILPEIGTYLND